MSSYRPPAGIDVSGIELVPGLGALERCPDGSVPALVLASFLASTDVAALGTDGQVLDVVVLTDRLKGWVDAMHLAAVAELARRPDVIGPDHVAAAAPRRPLGETAREFCGDEVGAALGLTSRGGEHRVVMATALAGSFPATLAALGAGRLDYPRALAVTEEAAACSPGAAAEVEARVLSRGRHGSPGRFRRAVGRAVLRVDAAAARERAAAARADTWARATAGQDGMGWLDAHLAVEDAAAIRAALDAAAVVLARAPGEERTTDQLRAVALAAPFWAALTTGELATPDGPLSLAGRHGEPPALLLTLGGEHDELAGFGAVPRDVAREIAARAVPGSRSVVRVRAAVDGAAAADLAAAWPQEPRYRPSAALSRHVALRDGTCRFPGCASTRCDLEHTRPYPQGPTHPANLGLVCRRHHRLKQSPGVRLEQPRPGWFVWTLPTGHRYETGPPG